MPLPKLFRLALSLLVLVLVLAAPGQAQDRTAVERQFQSWLHSDIWPAARARGVTRATFEAAFKGVRLNWDLPDLVPPGAAPPRSRAQRQAEFGQPARYFSGGTLQSATSIGRDMARRHAATLARIEARYGVPGHILLAVWGRESSYGRAAIRNDAFEVLGTKGFMATRKDYFRDELIAALELAQSGAVSPRAMRSSWAGALGQPQFMPSNVLRYGQDGDGDGRTDIWGSVPDTLASIAHYLARHGWDADRDWGYEVRLPAALACTELGPDQARPLAAWEGLGLTRVSGRPFPQAERRGPLSLLMPAGTGGPAFLVTPNFYVLKEYNFSDLYALFVGHVGDRIAYGAGNFHARWAPTERFLRSDIAAMQRALEAQGHDVGGADGLVGFKTRRAIGRWQEGRGARPTCWPDRAMLGALR